MTDSVSADSPNPKSAALSPAVPSNLQSPESLPPVEPPSASFIMQLFLVPGLIVAAVIGVWALFGQLSSGEQDWRQLIAEIRSTNEHRRWRGATSLAQVLRADAELGDAGQKLSANPQIAQELANVMNELLQESVQDKELISQQSFVARTLGWMDSQDIVLPPLMEAVQPKYDQLVRSDALKAIAMLAGRLHDAGKKLDDEPLAQRVIEASNDGDVLIRQVACYTLGLLHGDAVIQRLKVLAEDADFNTRVNAGLALARHKLPDGVPVFANLFEVGNKPVDPATMKGESESERRTLAEAQQTMNSVSIANALKAVRDLDAQLTTEQRQQLIPLCEGVAKDTQIPRVRMEAQSTLRTLQGQAGN